MLLLMTLPIEDSAWEDAREYLRLRRGEELKKLKKKLSGKSMPCGHRRLGSLQLMCLRCQTLPAIAGEGVRRRWVDCLQATAGPLCASKKAQCCYRPVRGNMRLRHRLRSGGGRRMALRQQEERPGARLQRQEEVGRGGKEEGMQGGEQG